MTKDEKLQSAREFARRVIQRMWDDGDVNGGEIQDLAQELGLIYSRITTRADRDEYGSDVGDTIFEFEKWMRQPPPKSDVHA